MENNKKIKHILSSIFGFDSFRIGQAEIINAAIKGQDVLAIMPTGGGKSLCFQLPALMQSGLTVVISPLIALMRDQIFQLRANGVKAASINSSYSEQDNQRTIDAAINGDLSLLYISPERLRLASTIEFLLQANVKIVAVDEAHCISQWGHDFRPEYQEIGKICDRLGGVQILAFTATADEQTRQDIVEKLFRKPPEIFLHGFDRPNLKISMSVRNNGKKQLLTFLDNHQNQSGIIYCQSRKKVEQITQFLNDNNIKAHAYHAGLSKEQRDENQDIFLIEDAIIIVATIAFGMGIDKPDVRFVFHMDLPKNIESYYQEIGRAGRDNLPAFIYTLYGLSEIYQYRRWIEQGDASIEQKQIEHQKLSSLVALCEAPLCRKVALLAYFGEDSEPCGDCDLCSGEIKTYDGTINAQKALSTIIRTKQIFGLEQLVSVLLGQENEMSIKHNHHNLSTFGIGRDISAHQWKSIFRQLLALGLINIDATNGFNSWVVSEDGWLVMRGQQKVQLREEIIQVQQKSLRRKSKKQDLIENKNCNQKVLTALKARRLTLAREKNKPAFVIFSDRSLIDMAVKLPKTLDEMSDIYGVGDMKLKQFGEDFLSIIAQEL